MRRLAIRFFQLPLTDRLEILRGLGLEIRSDNDDTRLTARAAHDAIPYALGLVWEKGLVAELREALSSRYREIGDSSMADEIRDLELPPPPNDRQIKARLVRGGVPKGAQVIFLVPDPKQAEKLVQQDLIQKLNRLKSANTKETTN